MKSLRLSLAAFLCTLLLTGPAYAQLPGNQSLFDSALLKLFGENTEFVADAEVHMLGKDNKEVMSMPLTLALLDGQFRAEVDMSKMKSTQAPPQALAMFKQTGLDRIITIVRPDKKSFLIVYPNLKAYAEEPMPATDSSSPEDMKMEKSALGKETIDGHPCTKNKVTVTNTKGEKQEAIIWNAQDMKEFPLKMQLDQEGNTVVMHYKNVKLSKPPADLFEVPDTFLKHASNQELMQSAMMKMLSRRPPGQ